MYKTIDKNLFFGIISRSMRIAMIGQKGYPARSGGVEKHVEELSKRLGKQGHDVFVFCRSWYVTDSTTDKGIHRIFTPSLHTKHLDTITHVFFSILKAARLNVDIFHLHGVGPALLSWLPKIIRPSAKVVVTFHSIDRYQAKWNGFAKKILHFGETAACRFPDQTITISKTLTEYCQTVYQTETRYIPNGVTTPPSSVSTESLKTFDLEPNRYFLMVARLVPHKGQHTLITAWKQAKIKQPTLFQGFKLVIVGGSSFTDVYKKELIQLAGDDTSIILTGEQTGETLSALYAHAYAGVHPSMAEGLPISVLEAMSHGKCVLASDIPEHLEITEQYGLNFRAGCAESLTEHLIMMIESPELVAHVGHEAALFVQRNYHWDEIALHNEMVYKQLLFPVPLPQQSAYIRTQKIVR
jgi:glycosyltransferase involved in cell wall biosynthesis